MGAPLNAIGLDVSRWPIVIVTPPSSVTSEDMEEFFANYDRLVYARNERHVTVLDLRRCQGMPPAQRKMLTDRMQKNEGRAKMFSIGNALIFESVLLRSLLTAILWMREPVSPVKVFGTVEEGCQWGRALLEQYEQTAQKRVI